MYTDTAYSEYYTRTNTEYSYCTWFIEFDSCIYILYLRLLTEAVSMAFRVRAALRELVEACIGRLVVAVHYLRSVCSRKRS